MEELALIDLLARLAAEGPDRELDAAIGAALRIGPKEGAGWIEGWALPFVVHPRVRGAIALPNGNGEVGVHWRAEPYTTSLDAALALVERVLPFDLIAMPTFVRYDGGTSGTAVITRIGDGSATYTADGKTAAVALLCALIKALIAREDQP